MRRLTYHTDSINVYFYEDAKLLIQQLSNQYAGDVTQVASGGRYRNRIEYYNYPCSFDIETTTVKPGELDYPYDPEAAPVAFPYLFQWNIYGKVIMCRKYEEALQIFRWLSEYFRTGGNRRLVIFDHNLGYEEHFFRSLWSIAEGCFAMDEHHPVTIVTKEGLMFRDSYKMTNMSLEALTKDWSRKWKKDKEIMDYSQLRTPYTELDDNTLIYSALDVLSLSDAIIPFLAARNEFIWTKCPTSTSFIRKGLKQEIGIGVKKRNEEQKEYFKYLKDQIITYEQYLMLVRIARGGNTHANRAYTGQLLSDLCHFDITSSYPAQMICYPEYPLGIWQPLDPGSGMEVIEDFQAEGKQCCMFDMVLVNPRLKKGVTVPYISISKMIIVEGSGMRYTDNGRYIEGLKAIQISIFGIEWPIIKSQYDYDDAFITSGYFCDKGYLPDIIRRYILQLYKKKTELKGIKGQEVEYALSKTYVNGVFGMAYTNPLRDTYEVTEDGIELMPEEDPEGFLDKYQHSISYFIPYVAGAVTAALGRVYLQKMIDAAGADFVYCDTDSIFALHPDTVRPKIRKLEEELKTYQRQCGMELTYYDIKGRPHELGGIDEEPYCEQFKTYGAKKYITVEDGKLTCTIAGVPKKTGSALIGSPENFQLGFNFKGKDTGKNCLWYNPPLGYDLHDSEGRPIHVYYNVAMLPCDYLLSLSSDYTECLSIEGNFHWQFKEADRNTLNEEDL